MITFFIKNILLKIYIIIPAIIGHYSCDFMCSIHFLNIQKTIIQPQYIFQKKIHIHFYKTPNITLQKVSYFIFEKKLFNKNSIKIKKYNKNKSIFKKNQLQKQHTFSQFHDIKLYLIKKKINLKKNNQLIYSLNQIIPKENQTHIIIPKLLTLIIQQQSNINNIKNKITLKLKKILLSNITVILNNSNTLSILKKNTIYYIKKTINFTFYTINTNDYYHKKNSHLKLTYNKFISKNNHSQIFQKPYNQYFQKTTKHDKTFFNQNDLLSLPESIKMQIQTNSNLSNILTQQKNYTSNIILKQKETVLQISQVQQILTNLIEQAQWIHKSPALGEILHSKISKLPKTPNFKKLDNNMVQLRAKRLQYADQIDKLPLLSSQYKQNDIISLTENQKKILKEQLCIHNNLVTELLNNYDCQILELTKLKILYEQLQNKLKEIQKATNRYLFWIADMHPINIYYLFHTYQDIHTLLVEDKFLQQIKFALYIIFNNQSTLILIIFSTIFTLSLHLILHQHYKQFLEKTSNNIKKIYQDNFLSTFYNIWFSILMASPIPILWGTIGYILNNLWSFPIAFFIGQGINNTILLLWICTTSAYFASPHGLFSNHFGWPEKKIKKVFSKYYIIFIIAIISLIITLNLFNNYNERKFASTLGRLSFILLCIFIALITNTFKKSGLLLYMYQHKSSNNIINRFLWNIMIYAPIILAAACIYGYSFASEKLLKHLEISLLIYIVSLIIYHIVRRWISIQRRRIAFMHKKRYINKATFPQEKKYKSYLSQDQTKKLTYYTNNTKTLDLNKINKQSLQLIRSILTIIAILFIILSWSELHSAFSFLDNITLWDVTSTIQGVNNVQPITLNSVLITILVIIITVKTVRNLPAFLELTLLQHLNIMPSTKYAITTLNKYILMLIGSIIGFSLIGIEWAKIQWLIAALSVGLGFGLQEIFANFISGLIILFEKPIRIGDTVTIQNLTGNVKQINIRATTIIDRNHKDIIIPNKEFITNQFINWSLSDTITRVVLKIPIPIKSNIEKINLILLNMVKNSPLTLHTPPPEVYLIDLQQGLPIFEIRAYVADIKSRAHLCHQIHMLIIEYCKKNKLKLPYLSCYSKYHC